MQDTDAVAALAALAHEDRLAAFRHLVKAGPEGDASGAIADSLAIPATRMSFHLRTLERAGLVTTRRTGRQIIYLARFTAMRALLSHLTEDCCGGRPEICGGLPTILEPQEGS